MKLIPSGLPGVLIVEPDVHRDSRGFFLESYHARKYQDAGIDEVFVQDNHSRSVGGTLRGLHAQYRKPQAKLVRVLAGEIFDVAVDIRRGSPTFGRWVGAPLSAENCRQIYVPRGFAHGFYVVSEVADVEYKVTDFYDPGGELTLAWNDPEIAITWPTQSPLVSEKDRAGLPLRMLLDLLPTMA